MYLVLHRLLAAIGRAAAAGTDIPSPEPEPRWLTDEELMELRRLLARLDPGALHIVDTVIAPRARLLADDEIERVTDGLDHAMRPDTTLDLHAVYDLMAAIQPLSERFWR